MYSNDCYEGWIIAVFLHTAYERNDMHKSLHGRFSIVHFTYVYIRAFIRLLFHVSFGSSIILYNIVPCLSVLLKMFKFYFVIVEIYFLNLHTERGRGREREKERERENPELRNSAKKKNWALQWQVSGTFTISVNTICDIHWPRAYLECVGANTSPSIWAKIRKTTAISCSLWSMYMVVPQLHLLASTFLFVCLFICFPVRGESRFPLLWEKHCAQRAR